jgi:hypothetical protein
VAKSARETPPDPRLAEFREFLAQALATEYLRSIEIHADAQAPSDPKPRNDPDEATHR